MGNVCLSLFIIIHTSEIILKNTSENNYFRPSDSKLLFLISYLFLFCFKFQPKKQSFCFTIVAIKSYKSNASSYLFFNSTILNCGFSIFKLFLILLCLFLYPILELLAYYLCSVFLQNLLVLMLSLFILQCAILWSMIDV